MSSKRLQRGGLLTLGAIVLMVGVANAQVVKDRYIVVLNDNVGNPRAVARQLGAAHRIQIGFVYEHAIRGFSFGGSAAAAQAIGRNPLVKYVEQDQIYEANCHGGDPQVVPTGIQRSFAASNPNVTIDGNDDLRIDVDIAIIDTGIDINHFDLNVVNRTDCSGGSPMNGSCTDDSGDDGNGHGTHVAGSAAAIDNEFGVVGVAPGARLWAVKVLSDRGSGYTSWIIAGIDYVTLHADEIDVANMSLGGSGSSSAQDAAIAASVAAGVSYVVSAGNSDADAAGFTPANHPDVVTVSALADSDGAAGGVGGPTCNNDIDDTLADFSNWGSTVEITGPGDCILSTYKDGMCAVISGTSMSSPHVAGAAALLSASGYADPFDIRDTLIATGNFNWVDDSGDGIQEPLLDVSNTTIYAPATVPGTAAPSCSIDADCDDADACTTDTCSGGTCSNTAIDCDDANACTADSCLGGVCSNDAISCDDGNACTTDSCDTATGCVNTSINCDDGDPCTTDSCDSATGLCDNVASGTCCGDGTCETGEDSCSCSADCGAAPTSETNCTDGIDEDCDGAVDCADSDCSGDPACASSDAAIIDCITYDKNVTIDVTIVDDLGDPVSGASVTVEVAVNGSAVGSATGTTDSSGVAGFRLRGTSNGDCITTTILDVTADGLTWDGTEPADGYQKQVDSKPDADCRNCADACGDNSCGQ